jgi:3-oxoacyl-[acyl-carrier protein] reductase
MNIVVTGAASGIGCRLATLLVQAGHSVAASDIDYARLQASAEKFAWPSDALLFAHDVTSPQSWSDLLTAVVGRWKALEALINVAGVLRVEALGELNPQSIALQVDVNVKGVMLGTQSAAKVMLGQGRGRIINIASMAALAPIPGISVYSATKFAVRGFSLAAAQELEPRGVQVSVVCPDAVDTPMVDYQLDHAGAALTFSGSRMLTADEDRRAASWCSLGRAVWSRKPVTCCRCACTAGSARA